MPSYRDFFSPRFFLEIAGKDATDLMPYISKFEYKDNEKKADELTITFNNSGVRWQDDFRMARGVPIKVRWGYVNDVSDTRQMNVVNIELACPADIPTLQLTAYDIKKEMSKKGKAEGVPSKNWGRKSSSDIAAAIARKHRLSVDVYPSGDARKEERVQTAAVDDMTFLTQLATQLHWDCFVEAGVLHFHPKRFGSAPKFEFTYFTDRTGTCLDFSSELDLRKLPKTGKASADPKTGKPTEEKADGKTTDESLTGYFLIDTELGAGMFTPSVPTPESDAGVVKKHAKAQQAGLELAARKAKISVIGTPMLTSKVMIRVNGVGNTSSGVWRVKEARHVIEPSGNIYTTECDLVRNADGMGNSKKDKANGGNDKATDADGNKKETVVIDAALGAILLRGG
jgi:phage protein D